MEYEIAALVRDCHHHHPGITLSLRPMSAADVTQAVTTGQADIGLTLVTDPAHQPPTPGLHRQTLFELPLVPIGDARPTPPGHHPAIENVLVVDPACTTHTALLHHLRTTYGLETPTLQAGSAHGAIGLAKAGLGVAMLPEKALTETTHTGTTTLIPWLPRTTTHVQALWNAATHPTPATTTLLHLLRHTTHTHQTPTAA
ncbi:LysR family transcriptional regulator substrate-binding protein [Kitasatospora sp. NPDC051853]|uniref:LysR family transcriptional regulator substrate-binding protein n=1 Tax=Kitasatospora sp. NPDC051853 TaxID=3364058 RepID=UPI0037AB5D44